MTHLYLPRYVREPSSKVHDMCRQCAAGSSSRMSPMIGDTNVATVRPNRALEAAARRLSRTWLVSLACAVLLPLVTLGVSVVMFVWGDDLRWYALLGASLTVSLAYNVSRFVPRRREDEYSTLLLTPVDAEHLAQWIESIAPGWRPTVRVAPSARVGVEDGTLTIGLPFFTCLRRDELAWLVADAHVFGLLDTHPSTRRARWIAAARLGGALRHREGKESRTSRRLLHRIDAAAGNFHETTFAWADHQRGQRGPAWQQTAQVLDVVVEAWHHVCVHWLEPALTERVWHPEPFTGLRAFLDACERSGLVSLGERPQGESAATLLREPWRYEAELAAKLVEADENALEPTPWEEHPSSVSVPRWRHTFAAALVAADRSTGQTQPANVDSVLTLLEGGWSDTLVAVLTGAPAGPSVEPPPVREVIREVLTAAISVAVIDAAAGRTIWEWPFGTALVDRDGQFVEVGAVVLEALDELEAGNDLQLLRGWLATQGVDVRDPLWLGEGVAPDRERSLLAFNCYRGLRTSEAVLSTQALRLFPVTNVRGTASDIRLRMDGTAFQERMSAVDAGDFTGQASGVMFGEVVTATFSPMIGGHWWRLRLTTQDGTTSIRGNGAGSDIEEELAAQLGDRLRSPWSRRAGWLLTARNFIGFVGLGFGCFAWLMVPWMLISPPTGLRRVEALIFLPIGAAFLLIGLLPDVVARAWDRLAPSTPANRRQR
jgi:hypothetical protein